MPTNELLEIPADVKDAAQKVWFAGLGALAMAQEESGKLFNMLVERGAEVEKAGLAPVATVKETAKETAKGTASVAEDAWKKIQATLDAQVTAALHRLGVPTRDEIGTLTKRIEQLTASIEALKARG
jgi:poly(hydroxyalkanoate) granule-associated protein